MSHGFKDILVLADGAKAASARAEAAIALATSHGAHLTALCLVPEPYIPAMVGVHLPADVLQRQIAEQERQADAVLEKVREAGERAGLAVELRRETATADALPGIMARHGRHADVVIAGQPDPEDSLVGETLIVETAFMSTGRPAIVVPFIGARTVPPERIVCAWDGSAEAARALNDALPLLRAAREVSLTVIDAQSLEGRLGAEPGADMAGHLARHGVKVTVESLSSGGLSTGDVLLGHLAETGCDMLVMGGYGHSRLRELVLGGVTAHLMAHMTVPVFLAH